MADIPLSRRRFCIEAAIGAAAGLFIADSTASASVQPGGARHTIQQVIDHIIASVVDKPLQKTVDTVKLGDTNQEIKAIATTFLATTNVLQQAVEMGVNLVITHEPIFYNHLDETEWLAHDPIYRYKREFILDHHLVVWRCHDYAHMMHPDVIVKGMQKKLGWENFARRDQPDVYDLPESSVNELAKFLKQTLNSSCVQIVGNPTNRCTTVALLVGAPGGRSQIEMAIACDPSVLICGEINEWETNIYFQDMQCIGKERSLILVGHRASEESGMQYLGQIVTDLIPNIEVLHIQTEQNLTVV